MDWAALSELVKIFGVPLTLSIVILYGGSKGWWVFGWVYRAIEEDRNYWRDEARGVTGVAETAVAASTARRGTRTRAART